MNAFSAIAFRMNGQAWWVLSTPGCPEVLNPDNDGFPELRSGVKAHLAAESATSRPPILLDESPEGGLLIRLLETRRYEWEIIGADDAVVSSSLQALPQRQWSTRRIENLSGAFTVVNHLGIADFRVSVGGRDHVFALEITSAKLEYDTEFRQITEDIASFCQQLLLNWDAPTSLGFENDPAKLARITLEQFLFLRSHLPPERLEEILESIQRRPNSRLVCDASWTPAACAGSPDWLRDPAAMARDWQEPSCGGKPLPGQVLDVRKEDSVDTAANRFIKFALKYFRDLCREVLEKHPNALSLRHEAGELAGALDAVISRPFFRKLGPLTRLPLDNPTLQKRDGYRDILHAWLLTQAAAALSWDRDEDTYQGPTRNVATLYEYWVFLQIHKILDDMDEVTRDLGNPKPSDDAERFLEVKNGELHISLKRGRKTCAPFTVRLNTGMVLRLHLYYERTFQLESGATDAASYSRQFKPDYTLVVFPERFSSEAAAATEGKIAYVHFDAKYRAENLKMIFGELTADLDEEKMETKSTSIYKRGDLLKMHTYNDAVRQTAGSYVLYPGSDTETRMSKFHEILPGVGAFVLKPGRTDCHDTLRNFLMDVFRHQADQFTQYRSVSNVVHATVSESPVEYGGITTYRPGATCVLVYSPNLLGDLFREKKLAYCHALRDDDSRSPVRIQLSNLSGAVICCYTGGRTGEKTTLPWIAAIISCEMVSRETLHGILRHGAWPASQLPTSAAAYLLFRLDTPSAAPRRKVTELTPRGSYQAVSKTLGELNACSAAD